MKTILAALGLIILGTTISHAQVSGTFYGPNGISTWSGNSSGGTIYGPDGISSYTRNGSGGTLYGPNGISTWSGGTPCAPIFAPAIESPSHSGSRKWDEDD